MVVVGGGRVGTALALRARARGEPCRVVRRGEALDAAPGEPVLVAVRTDDLEAALAALPNPADAVVVQNGALRDWLAARGLGGVTRGALYLLATGDEGTVGAGSPFAGPHARAVAGWMKRLGIAAHTVGSFDVDELVKLVWLAAHGPLCEARSATVGEIAEHHLAELDALSRELLAVGAAAWGARPDPDAVIAHSGAYSRAIAGYRASIKEWPWRNGWFVAQARLHGVPTPLHDALVGGRG